jgi:hypothetical protein
VYSAEINTVLAHRLWPRSIVQPPLTEADQVSLALQALQNRRMLDQHVHVTFDDTDKPTPDGTKKPAKKPTRHSS